MKRLRQIVANLFLEFDTVTIRLMMAWASLLFAGALLASPEPFTRDAYAIMSWVAPQWVWAFSHVVFGICTTVLIAFPNKVRYQERVTLLTNIFGFMLWSFYTTSVNVSVGYFAPSTALELIGCCLLLWALARTNYGRKVRHG